MNTETSGNITAPELRKKKDWQKTLPTKTTNLVRRGDRGIYYARVKVDGKLVWKSLKTDTLGIAKIKLRDAENAIRAAAQSIAKQAEISTESSTVGSLFKLYLDRTTNDPSLAEASKVRRETCIKAIIKTWPGIQEVSARNVSSFDVEEWARRSRACGTGFRPMGTKARAEGPMSPSAFNKNVDVLRSVFDLAVKLGLIYGNPVVGVSKAPIAPKRLKLPSQAQFRAMIDAMASAGTTGASRAVAQDCADLAEFCTYSGCRIAEAALCTWAHVDWDGGRLQIPGTKTKTSFRWIPLFPSLRSLLERIKARAEPELSQRICGVRECQKSMDRATAKVGAPRITHHDLRHLFATRCIEAGVDIPTVSRWLGHNDGGALAMKTYGHLRDEHSKAQALKVTF